MATATTTYYAYALGGANGFDLIDTARHSTITPNNSGTIADTASSGNLTYLGDTTNDTFTLSGSATIYTYYGLGSVTTSTGQIVNGFVGYNGSTYYLFTDQFSTLKDANATTVSTTPDNTSKSSTWWNIDTNAPGCFVAGTLIATPDGAVPVETLAAGDLVLTADGRALPVRWLGRSTINLFRAADRASLLPIRIRAGALDENMPARDLLVSPGHAIRVGDVLAHAGALVNGTSIVQERDMPMVFPYYHVELDSHAVLRAEGAPAESFLDGVEDLAFDNAGERPAGGTMQEMDCPRIRSARQLPRAVKEHLAARAAALSGTVAAAA